jgi:DnaJ-class molecular chaperone
MSGLVPITAPRLRKLGARLSMCGEDQMKNYRDCPECDGEGQVEYEVPVHASNSNPYGFLDSVWGQCGNCRGSGLVEIEDEDLMDGEVE